jgi:hypothetical protein
VEIPYLKAEALIEVKRGSSREKDRADIAALTDIIRNQTSGSTPPDFNLDSIRLPPEPQ